MARSVFWSVYKVLYWRALGRAEMPEPETEKKKEAALAAVRDHVTSGMTIGLGTGRTAIFAIEEIGRLVRDEGFLVRGIPTSLQSEASAREAGIPMVPIEGKIDLAIDGADEVDANLNLIKGGGGALTREKIVDSRAEKFVVVVDDSKTSKTGRLSLPVPIEVIEFSARAVMSDLRRLGAKPAIRMSRKEAGAWTTDNGNIIVDADFGEIADPESLERKLDGIPGIVENGLFTRMAAAVYVGCDGEVKKLTQ